MALLDTPVESGVPMAPRLRRPSWRDPRLIVGLVLLLGSVAIGARVVAAADNTSPVYAARVTLPTGTALTPEVVEVVRLRLGPARAAYLDARRPLPVGQVLARAVGAGEIVPVAATAPAEAARYRPVTIPLDGGPPAGIAPGGLVDVWASARRLDAVGGGYAPPRRIAAEVEVFAVQRPGAPPAATRTGAVQVLLPADGLAPVLDVLANQARVVVLPVPGLGRPRLGPMSLTVLTAVVGRWEAPLVSGLERSAAGVEVVRRCADLAELLAAASAGLAGAVVLSADLQRLDRDAVTRLLAAGVAVVGLYGPDDPGAAQRLAHLGVAHALPADTPTEQIAETVALATAEQQARTARARIGLADPGHALPAGPPGLAAVPVLAPTPAGRVVTVWGPVGSPGRTTVAVTLAAELAGAGHETLLVDADTYGAGIAQTLGLLDESAGLAAAARAANQGALDVARLAELAPPVTAGLRVLTGLPQSRRWPELRPAALDVVWQHARRLSTWTVIDAGFGLEADEELMFDTAAPRRHGATLSALAAADVVLAVGAAEPLGLQRLFSGLHELADVVPAGLPVTVVVTRIRDDAVGPRATDRVRAALERYAGVTEAVLIPDDRAGLDAAMLAGRSLREHVPASPARAPVAALAAELCAGAGLPGPSTGTTRAGRAGRWNRGRRRRSA